MKNAKANKGQNVVILETPKKLEILTVGENVMRSRFYGVEIPLTMDGTKLGTNEGNVFPYVSYGAMVKMFVSNGLILNNNIIEEAYKIGWNVELENGTDYDEDEDYFVDVYQWYIIDADDAERLKNWTNELIYYIYDIDMYLLGVTHCGTGWSCVCSDMLVYGLDEIENENDVRALAKKYQYYVSNNDIYMSELIEWQAIFEELGQKFGLIEEFKENGII